jgi:GTP-binding protein YchF
MYNPKKLVETTFEFTDIAGLVKGASKGEGLGNKFLSHIREVDAICEVVRCFDDSNIIHVEGNTDPIRDVEIINIELTLADLDVVQNRISKIEKKAQTSKDKDSLKELAILKLINEALESDIPVRRLSFTEEEQKIIKGYNLLTSKPIIYIANILESDIGKENHYIKVLQEYAVKDNAEVIEMCAKVESEISSFTDEEKNEFLKELGAKESGLDSLIHATYHLLGLKTFFTVGSDEVRAWTFKNGMKAPECAGIIHTDFQRGFIKAEVMSYNDLIEFGNELKVKENGKLRLEGKEYEMKDGDICHFRFNV